MWDETPPSPPPRFRLPLLIIGGLAVVALGLVVGWQVSTLSSESDREVATAKFVVSTTTTRQAPTTTEPTEPPVETPTTVLVSRTSQSILTQPPSTQSPATQSAGSSSDPRSSRSSDDFCGAPNGWSQWVQQLYAVYLPCDAIPIPPITDTPAHRRVLSQNETVRQYNPDEDSFTYRSGWELDGHVIVIEYTPDSGESTTPIQLANEMAEIRNGGVDLGPRETVISGHDAAWFAVYEDDGEVMVAMYWRTRGDYFAITVRTTSVGESDQLARDIAESIDF